MLHLLLDSALNLFIAFREKTIRIPFLYSKSIRIFAEIIDIV